MDQWAQKGFDGADIVRDARLPLILNYTSRNAGIEPLPCWKVQSLENLELSLDGWLLFDFILCVNTAFVGLALLYWSNPWARRYNEWAIRIREKFPRLIEREGTRNAQR